MLGGSPPAIQEHAKHAEGRSRLDVEVDAVPHIRGVPGLDTHPDHEIARRQMTGFGGMICFEVGGGYAAACRVYDRLKVIRRAASLGGTESLVSLPVLTSQYGLTDEQLAAAGVTRGMLRLSVGLEDLFDLMQDLDQALGAGAAADVV